MTTMKTTIIFLTVMMISIYSYGQLIYNFDAWQHSGSRFTNFTSGNIQIHDDSLFVYMDNKSIGRWKVHTRDNQKYTLGFIGEDIYASGLISITKEHIIYWYFITVDLNEESNQKAEFLTFRREQH